MKALKVGTRASKLARIQTEAVSNIIRSSVPDIELQVVPVTTLGDRLPAEKRAEVEGKGAFTEDLETLLHLNEIDIAVHSMKDLPTKLGKGLMIGATPLRADPSDAFVSAGKLAFSELPKGAIVGTSSIRRKAQVKALRKDLAVQDLHGNVETRLGKLDTSQLGGIVIAAAGLDRLGRSERITQRFTLDEMVPAPCQGTIALEVRANDDKVGSLVRSIDDPEVGAVSSCERAFAIRLGGDCDIPAGFCATKRGDSLEMIGAVLSPDGHESVRHSATSDSSDPAGSGTRFAEELLEMGGARILGEIFR